MHTFYPKTDAIDKEIPASSSATIYILRKQNPKTIGTRNLYGSSPQLDVDGTGNRLNPHPLINIFGRDASQSTPRPVLRFSLSAD